MLYIYINTPTVLHHLPKIIPETMVEIMVMWESMAAWFTPTVLFCVTNLIIATVFIASTSNKHHHHVHGDSNSLTPLSRVSSFIDRARSMNLSNYTTAESHHHYPPQSRTANYSSSSRLAQSIHLSYCNTTPPELSESERHSVSQLTSGPSLFERVKSFRFCYNENAFPVESHQISNSPDELVRAPSFVDRVKSFKIASAFKLGSDSTQTENVDNAEHHVVRSKSEKTVAKKSVVEMKKSRSEVRIAPDDDGDNEDVNLRRPATTRESRNEFDGEVDAKADDFISRFRQQLKLQRLESLVRYNEMLNRRG